VTPTPAEAQDEQAHREKVVTIVVNGQPKQVPSKEEITFKEVVDLAYDNNPPSGPDVVITVTYKEGEHKKGSLVEGQSVKVKDGMVFNVSATNKS
jgi:Multiubiquitin